MLGEFQLQIRSSPGLKAKAAVAIFRFPLVNSGFESSLTQEWLLLKMYEKFSMYTLCSSPNFCLQQTTCHVWPV